jgi:sugar-phosphatase
MLFDMDGVLCDSRACVERIWQNWAREKNIDVGSILTLAYGSRIEDTLRRVAPHCNIEKEARKLELLERSDTRGIAAILGAKEVLSTLPRDRWAVVTSASRPLAVARLEAAGLPIPSTLIAAEDVVAGKPSPDGYLLAAEMLGYAPNQAVVVEDTLIGIQSARAASMRVIALETTYSREELNGADVCIADLRALRVKVLRTGKAALLSLFV